MTPHIRLRPEVPDDVLQITAYLIDRGAIEPAWRFVDDLPRELAELARMPGKGSIKALRLPGLGTVRTWRVRGFPNHLIYYRQVTDGIEVLMITHGSRNVRRLLRERLR